LDVLNVSTHDSELQAITAPPLISTIHKSPQHTLFVAACCVFTSRFLATALTVEILQLHELKSTLNGDSIPTELFFRVRVTLRLAVYHQSIRFGNQPLGTHDQISFFN
jgi:hypothetical protein